MNSQIEIKELPQIELAFVSLMGPQNLENAFNKIIQWAIPEGLMNDQTKMLTLYHDSFKDTEAHKVRMSASIILTKNTETNGEIKQTTLEAGKYIVGSFEIEVNEFEKYWTDLFLWMNKNGYKKADRPLFEIYYNNFNEHPLKKAIVDFCIPIV